jgi:beta-glucanase (GH16 family)
MTVLRSGHGAPGRASPQFADPHTAPGAWSLAWHDEFNGNLLDRSAWEPSRFGDSTGDGPFEPTRESTWFSTSRVAVRDGNLVLSLAREEKTINDRTYTYSGGVVQALKSHWVESGTYLEARIKVPECDGCWPAFWLVATDRYPPETDIFEFFGTQSDSRPSFNYHPEEGNQTGPDHYGAPDADYRGEYHTYGLLWEGTRAIPYLDGRPYPAVAAGNVSNLPMMLIMNLSVQAGHSPDIHSEMLVDWVRAWRADKR